METMVEVERATQEALRQDVKSLFQGASSCDARDGAGGGVESDGRSASYRAGRQPVGPQEPHVPQARTHELGSDRRDGAVQPGRPNKLRCERGVSTNPADGRGFSPSSWIGKSSQ